jgi:hypothetical protein
LACPAKGGVDQHEDGHSMTASIACPDVNMTCVDVRAGCGDVSSCTEDSKDAMQREVNTLGLREIFSAHQRLLE